jgi:hypothetical protein
VGLLVVTLLTAASTGGASSLPGTAPAGRHWVNTWAAMPQ